MLFKFLAAILIAALASARANPTGAHYNTIPAWTQHGGAHSPAISYADHTHSVPAHYSGAISPAWDHRAAHSGAISYADHTHGAPAHYAGAISPAWGHHGAHSAHGAISYADHTQVAPVHHPYYQAGHNYGYSGYPHGSGHVHSYGHVAGGAFSYGAPLNYPVYGHQHGY